MWQMGTFAAHKLTTHSSYAQKKTAYKSGLLYLKTYYLDNRNQTSER